MLNCQKLVVKNCQHHKIVTMLLQFCGVFMNFLDKKGCLGILCSCFAQNMISHFVGQITLKPPLFIVLCIPLHCVVHWNKRTNSNLFFYQTHCTSAKVLYIWCNFYNFHSMWLLFTTTNLLRVFCIFCDKVQPNTLIKAKK
jgi:hypothetical protein